MIEVRMLLRSTDYSEVEYGSLVIVADGTRKNVIAIKAHDDENDYLVALTSNEPEIAAPVLLPMNYFGTYKMLEFTRQVSLVADPTPSDCLINIGNLDSRQHRGLLFEARGSQFLGASQLGGFPHAIAYLDLSDGRIHRRQLRGVAFSRWSLLTSDAMEEPLTYLTYTAEL